MIYAAFLSIVLLGILILGQVDGPAGSATGFLLSCAFTWAVLLKRAELIGWISIGEAEQAAARGFGFGQYHGDRLAGRVARVPAAAPSAASPAAAAPDPRPRRLGRRGDAGDGEGLPADSARALADQRYEEARATVSAAEAKPAAARRDQKGAGGAKRAPKDAAVAKSSGARQAAAQDGAEAPAPPSAERYGRAKELLARVDRNQSQTGQRWSDRDLQRFEAEDHELLRSSRDPADHAHRAGYERTQFEALRGPERERAEQEIEKARKRDSQRLEVASEVPGRIIGRRRQGVERMRQGLEELGDLGSSTRPEHLSRLRRERRAAASALAPQPQPGGLDVPGGGALALCSLLRRLCGADGRGAWLRRRRAAARAARPASGVAPAEAPAPGGSARPALRGGSRRARLPCCLLSLRGRRAGAGGAACAARRRDPRLRRRAALRSTRRPPRSGARRAVLGRLSIAFVSVAPPRAADQRLRPPRAAPRSPSPSSSKLATAPGWRAAPGE